MRGQRNVKFVHSVLCFHLVVQQKPDNSWAFVEVLFRSLFFWDVM